jgi:hypothetical protein
MADDVQDTPLAQRLMARNAGGPGLHRVSMPDGGEAYSGPLANRALKALGARAFTVDKSVIVDRAFDRAKGEDQALYAHERFHQRESAHKAEGGEEGASHGGKDAEEMAARAIESMVLHRAKQGEDFGSIMGDVNSGAMDDAAKGGGGEGGEDDPKKAKVVGALIGGGKDRDPMDGYKAMLKDGRTHWQIVNELKDHVIATLDRLNEEHEFRTTDASFLTGGH